MAKKELSPFKDPTIEWSETPTAHVYEVDLSGLEREEMRIELEDGRVLKITGERRIKKEEWGDWWHHAMRASARFTTSIRLPQNCKPLEMEESMEDGVLTIMVPKPDVRTNRRPPRAIKDRV